MYWGGLSADGIGSPGMQLGVSESPSQRKGKERWKEKTETGGADDERKEERKVGLE